MIGLDTNVLVRLLVADDEDQHRTAVRFVKEAVSRREALFVNRVVLAELAWALARAYRRSREEIASAVERILLTAEFEVEGSDQAWSALEKYRRGGADFADCLIGASNSAAGCTKTATFDKAAGKLRDFTLLDSGGTAARR